MTVDISETLIGISEIAVALAGFTGIVVAFGSRREGAWHPGDRIRLGFLLEASLTAAGFALLGLLLVSTDLDPETSWLLCSVLWSGYMMASLFTSRAALKGARRNHGDVDRFANNITVTLFVVFIIIQLFNALVWREFWPFLGGLILNLAGAAMQFARLIRSAFRV